MIVSKGKIFSIYARKANVSTAKITFTYLTPNEDGSGNFTVFPGDQTFYCVVKVANAPEDTTLKAVWTAVEVEGVDPNFLISEFELTTESENEFTFNLQNDQLWPSGSYNLRSL